MSIRDTNLAICKALGIPTDACKITIVISPEDYPRVTLERLMRGEIEPTERQFALVPLEELAAHGYVPAPSDSWVGQPMAVTGRAEAWDLSRAIEKLRGSVFHSDYVEQMRAFSMRLSSDRPVNDGVTTKNYRLNEAERTEAAEDRMWRASKSFDKGQV